jgi:glycosyltransferase involved in cell wall biosynthesis
MKNRDKPHICFVAPDAWPVLVRDVNARSVGGAQVQQCLVGKALVRRGFRVSMVCLDYGQKDETTVEGVTVFKCEPPTQRMPLRCCYPRLTGLWSAMRRADADIYYQRSAAAYTGIVGLFARRHGRRFVYAAACDLDVARDETRRLFQRRAGWRDYHLFRLGLTLATDVVVQHAQQMQEFMHWHGRASTIVPSCYAEQPPGMADPHGFVLWVSTLRTGKRPELLLEIARRLPHLRFRMVGGPSSEAGGESAFARISDAAASIPNLEFIGFVPFSEVHTHFNGARVLVNTSDYEGFPNTFLQSWSRGIPTVSFRDTGSIVDDVKVVNVANDLDQMTSLVSRLMTDDNYWREAGMVVRTCYERSHTPDAAVDIYERLFAKQWKETDEMRSQIRRTA